MDSPESSAAALPQDGPIASDLLDQDRLITSEELAKWLGVPLTTLDAWASRGGGPVFHRVSKYRRYVGADVKDWLRGQRRDDRHESAA